MLMQKRLALYYKNQFTFVTQPRLGFTPALAIDFYYRTCLGDVFLIFKLALTLRVVFESLEIHKLWR